MQKIIVLIIISFFTALNASYACELGKVSHIQGCAVNCHAEAQDNQIGCRESCIATVPSYYLLLDYIKRNHSQNNGGASYSRIESEQKFDYSEHIRESYSQLLEIAQSYNDEKMLNKIKQDMKYEVQEALKLSSSHQAVRLTVYAKGQGAYLFNLIRNGDGWSNHSVTLKVKCVSPQNTLEQLKKKYNIK